MFDTVSVSFNAIGLKGGRMKTRAERFVIGSSGCIKEAETELFFTVKNMSTTGFLIELKDSFQIKSEQEFYALLDGKSGGISFYVFNPEVTGLASIVTVELVNRRFVISMKFSEINFNSGFMVFKRRLPRTGAQVQGQLFWQQQWYSFLSEDIGLNGLSVKLNAECPVTEDERVTLEVPTLSFCGSARVKWSAPEDFRLGVEYINLTHN
jgi:hypothetical protein